MIKAQTAAKGGLEGREEGRKGGGEFPGETGQAGYAEGEGGGEGGGETQGWLVPSRGCVLTEALYMLVSNRRGQNIGWPLCDIQCTGEEHTHYAAPTQRHIRELVCAQTHMFSYYSTQHMQMQTCNYMHTLSSPCRWQFGFR